MEKNPDHELADNAQFYVADSYYREENFPQAIVEFQRVLDEYTASDKSADAVYRTGMAYLELNDRRNATNYFQKVVDEYPDAEAATLARKRLNELKRTTGRR